MSDETVIRKAIAPAAKAAGMVDDPDALKVVDVSSIKLAVDGTPVVPYRFFDDLKIRKPHLFKRALYGRPDFNARAVPSHEADKAEREFLADCARGGQ